MAEQEDSGIMSRSGVLWISGYSGTGEDSLSTGSVVA